MTLVETLGEEVTRLQVKPHEMDYILFFVVIILCAVGVVTVYSASTVIALQSGHPASTYATKQLYSAIVGLVLCFSISRIPYRFWYRTAVPLAGLSLFLLVLVLIPHIGVEANGGRRWIGSGALHLQPSEIAIIATVIYLAFFFTKKVVFIRDFKKGLLPGLIVAFAYFALIMKEPDMGTGLTLVSTALILVFASGARLRPLLVLLGALLPVFAALALTESYRSARITSWLHPFHNSSDAAYQLVQGMTAISAGGWFGRGFDMSIEKMGYLPYPQTDFIFPVFVEEWGLVGAIAVLFAFAMLIWRGFRIARHSHDRFGALLSVGLTGMLTINAFINLGSVTGLLPVTGIPLPFISFGGTALVVYLMSMGILLSISRYTLDIELEVDHVADIIDVGEVQHFRGRKSDEQPLFQRRKPVRQPKRAEVHALKPRAKHTARGETWRGRQEVTATRTRDSRSSTRKPAAASGHQATWRERNASSYPHYQDAKSASHKKRKGFFRKER